MLDTIALTLERSEFEILEPDRFSPSARGLIHPPYYPLGGRGVFACVLNPTKTDFAEGRYAPRLTLAKRKGTAGFAMTLRVEFSAPKLIFGNNFDELISRDFEIVLATLHAALARLGVRTDLDALRAAKVSAIHYSKNIVLTDYTSCSMVMSELKRIDLSRRLDLSQTDWRDDGHAVRYHANSFEVTFYDKLKDLQKAKISEKRAVEKDYGPQLDLLRNRDAFPKAFEVLRMEVRLGNRTKIRSIMKKAKAEVLPTFAALFDASIAKDVLELFWAEVRAQLPLIDLAKNRRPEDLLADLAAANDSARPGKLLQELGAVVLIGSVGYRGAGAVLSRFCCPRSWQRYKRAMRNLPIGAGALGALKQVDEALAAFKPLRLANFQQAPAQGSVAAGASQKTRQSQYTERSRRQPQVRPVVRSTIGKK